jgi:hypothetical protein
MYIQLDTDNWICVPVHVALALLFTTDFHLKHAKNTSRKHVYSTTQFIFQFLTLLWKWVQLVHCQYLLTNIHVSCESHLKQRRDPSATDDASLLHEFSVGLYDHTDTSSFHFVCAIFERLSWLLNPCHTKQPNYALISNRLIASQDDCKNVLTKALYLSTTLAL